jgi:hypothetical protein
MLARPICERHGRRSSHALGREGRGGDWRGEISDNQAENAMGIAFVIVILPVFVAVALVATYSNRRGESRNSQYERPVLFGYCIRLSCFFLCASRDVAYVQPSA